MQKFCVISIRKTRAKVLTYQIRAKTLGLVFAATLPYAILLISINTWKYPALFFAVQGNQQLFAVFAFLHLAGILLAGKSKSVNRTVIICIASVAPLLILVTAGPIIFPLIGGY